jgi:hypothetical protein
MDFLIEAAGSLAGLPKHWIKYLTSEMGYRLGGEKSEITKLKQFHPWQIRNALKDENNLAVIGRIDGEPLFMITRHYDYEIKYHFFETTPGEGYHDSKGERSYYGRRGQRVKDSYTMNQVIDIVDQMAQDKTFENLTIESISKDPERKEKIEKRRQIKNIEDPLKKLSDRWSKSPSPRQEERAKKYVELKKPKIDKKLEEKKEKIKNQILNSFEEAFAKIEDDIKSGYTFKIDKKNIGNTLLSKIDISELYKIADAYGTITGYSRDPVEVSKKIKKLGL